MDRNLLIKLLNMTTSDHDNEALTAIRRSNALLKQSNLSWDDLIPVDPPEPSASTPEPPAEPNPEPDYRRDAPIRPKSANWGADLYGDEPSLSPSPTQDRLEPIHLDRRKAKLRKRIRSVPLPLRLALFPLWVFAETYVVAVPGESFPVKIMAFIATVAVSAIAGGLWFMIVIGLAKMIR